MRIALRRLLCLCLVAVAGRLGAQTTFNTVVVFGDSLSDTGNIAHLTQGASGGTVRYPSDIPTLGLDYTNGRFTDGKDTQPAATAYFGVWIEQLAASFAAKPAVTNSLDGGTNYAYGDATTAAGTTTVTEGPLSITLHNMGQQLTDYLGQSPAPVPNATTLYVLWGGSNDIYQAVSAATTAGTNPTTAATAAATTAVTNEAGYIQQLIARGATNFLVVNVPPLGGVPSYAGTATATALNTGSAAFAAALPQALASLKSASAASGITVNFYQTDVFTQFTGIAGSPILVGLSNVTAAAQNIAASPDTYLIWDGLHPTTTGHHLVAELAANLFTPLVNSVSTLTVPATAIAGQATTISARVTPQASSTVVPTGLVSFFNGTVLVGSGALSSTGTVSTSFLPTAAVSPYAITAIYSGDTTYGYSASAAGAVSVLGSAVSTTTSLSTGSASAGSGSSVTFTATVAPAVSTYGSPGGTVTFLDGTTTLGTGALSNGVATLATSTLAVGTHSITATYAANGLFAGSTSAAVTETIVTPGFTPAASPSSLAINAGSSGTTMLTASPLGGYTGTITLACGTLPAHLSCAFSTTTLAYSSSTNSFPSATLTLATNATANLALPDRPGAARSPQTFLAVFLLPGLGGLLWGAKRRRGWPTLLSLAVLLAAVTGSLTGCGGGSNNAAKGTYTVPVTFAASGGPATQTLNLTVTVQ